MSAMYPAPRWFREAVQEWADAHGAQYPVAHISDLFTRIVNAQPPDLRVVETRPSQGDEMPRRSPDADVGCEASTSDRYSVHYGKRCPNLRAVRIDGKSFCKRHAALHALFLLMRDGRAKRILRCGAITYGPIGAHSDSVLK